MSLSATVIKNKKKTTPIRNNSTTNIRHVRALELAPSLPPSPPMLMLAPATAWKIWPTKTNMHQTTKANQGQQNQPAKANMENSGRGQLINSKLLELEVYIDVWLLGGTCDFIFVWPGTWRNTKGFSISAPSVKNCGEYGEWHSHPSLEAAKAKVSKLSPLTADLAVCAMPLNRRPPVELRRKFPSRDFGWS